MKARPCPPQFLFRYSSFLFLFLRSLLTPSPRLKARPLTFLCFLAIHLSQLLSMSSHLDSLCLRTSRGTSSSLWSRGQGPSEVPREAKALA